MKRQKNFPKNRRITDDELIKMFLQKRDVKMVEKMSNDDLLEYIKNRDYRCCCNNLKKRVLKYGLNEIDKYDGMICGGVEDMFIRRGRW